MYLYDPTQITATLQQLFVDMRKRNNYTQNELANETGLSRQYISMLECGQQHPSLDTIIIFAETYNIQLGAIFSEFDRIYSKRVQGSKAQVRTTLKAAEKDTTQEYIDKLRKSRKSPQKRK